MLVSLNPHTAPAVRRPYTPRAPRKGFLRLSLVSCPIYLMRAATKTKSIRLHQVWMPRGERHTKPD